jgi:outer membrane protein OmpA-like peptidoglycan-associated protein
MSSRRLAFVLLACLMAGCTSRSNQGAGAPQEGAPVLASPQPSAAPTEATGSESPGPTVAPTFLQTPTSTVASAAPTATPNSNLLSMLNGAFIRRWTPGAGSGVESLAAGGSWAPPESFTKPVELTFELPSLAHITSLAFAASAPARVDFAASDDDRTYETAGSIDYSPGATAAPLAVDKTARYVRVTIARSGPGIINVSQVAAFGSAPPPAPANLNGYWSMADSPTAYGDSVINGIRGEIPGVWPAGPRGVWATGVVDRTLVEFSCIGYEDVWRGGVAGNGAAARGDSLVVVDGGDMLVGVARGQIVIAKRIQRPPLCYDAPAGAGSTVAVFTRQAGTIVPEADPKRVPGFRFTRTMLPLLDASSLTPARVALIAASCNAEQNLDSDQTGLLLGWVGAGHTLIIRDADQCTKSNYQFLPYPFTTSAAGAGGARGAVLSIADPSTLGSESPDAAHAVDVKAYLNNAYQQLGDTDIMTTNDPHWCGLMFAQNLKGAQGWIHAYARYQRGLIIYNGFDADDIAAQIPEAEKIAHLEYAQAPSGPLPCHALVAAGAPHPKVTRESPTIAQALLHAKRARIYGIHFDVASDRIQARSETVIAEIAQVLREYPSWHMRIEGYTDSDGGVEYNLDLSRRRAVAVAHDLELRYHVASQRLSAEGLGESHPIAPNTTDAGKALNRRVELVRM